MNRLICLLALLCSAAVSARVSLPEVPRSRPLLDIVDVQGVRENLLVGYGLVVGLSGSGDRSQVQFTSQSMTNMLKQFGVQLSEGTDPKLKNVAAVSVQARLPAFGGRGQKVDITVSSIGDAKSLRGGTLLLTPLRGVDGEVYAIAQGNLVVGGLSAAGQSGSSVTVNVPTSGIIPEGGIIEREIPSTFADKPQVVLNLLSPNFRTARNVERAINQRLGRVAEATSPGTVVVRAPQDPGQRVAFLALFEDIDVDMGRERPKVVFNSRTGTVVIGQDVKVTRAAVSHGSLTVSITESPNVSQPNAMSNGQTTTTPNTSIQVNHPQQNMFIWPEGTSLQVIVKAINSLGANPDDLMAILQALHEAGALDADLMVI